MGNECADVIARSRAVSKWHPSFLHLPRLKGHRTLCWPWGSSCWKSMRLVARMSLSLWMTAWFLDVHRMWWPLVPTPNWEALPRMGRAEAALQGHSLCSRAFDLARPSVTQAGTGHKALASPHGWGAGSHAPRGSPSFLDLVPFGVSRDRASSQCDMSSAALLQFNCWIIHLDASDRWSRAMTGLLRRLRMDIEIGVLQAWIERETDA
eukprot:555020-Amphidinium_carterae.2